MKTNTEEKMRHSAAHVLAQAIIEQFPDAKLGIGPATEDGYYYDFQTEKNIGDERSLLIELEERMNRIIEEELPFTQVFLSKDEAIDVLHQQGQIFKTELLQAVQEDEVSFFRTGEDFIDLCRGPHVENTGKIGAIKLTGFDEVHWLNNENRPLMYRISGAAFNNKKELESFLAFQASLKTRDHLQIGKKQDILQAGEDGKDFTFLEQGIGLKNMLYQTIERTLATSSAQKLQINQFKLIDSFTDSEYEAFYLDHDCIKLSDQLVFVTSPVAEAANYLREELKHDYDQDDYPLGRCFTYLKSLDLASLKNEDHEGLYSSIEIAKLVLSQLGAMENFSKDLRDLLKIIITYYKEILEDDFYFKLEIGEEEDSEAIIELLTEFNLNIKKSTIKGEGFKLKLFHKDIFKRAWEVANIRSFPELSKRLSEDAKVKAEALSYLQAEIITNTERLVAMMLEHYNGEFPIGLAPFQAIIVTDSEHEVDYAKSVYRQLLDQGVRVKINIDNRPLAYKIDVATRLKYPYILTIGEQEAKNNVFSVKPDSEEDLGLMSVAEFLQKLGELS